MIKIEEQNIIKQSFPRVQKKKVNLWFIGFLVIVLAFCIVIWEGSQYYYYEWKQDIYELGYNQSYIDTIVGIAQSGMYPSYWQTDNGSVLRLATLQQICGVGQDATTS